MLFTLEIFRCINR